MLTARRFALLALALCCVRASELPAQQRAATQAAACDVPDDPGTVARLTRDVAFLADDARLGREPGTPGFDAAAEHVTRALRELGVAPAGTDGYLQPFEADYGVEALPGTGLSFVRDGRAVEAGGVEVVSQAPWTGDGRAQGAVVFAGHGLVSQDARWDDLARGESVRDRVLVVLSGPPRPTDPARVEALRRANVIGSDAGKVRAAHERGARAVVIVALDGGRHASGWIDPQQGALPVIRVSREAGAALLGVPPDALTPATEPATVRAVPGVLATVNVATRPRRVRTANVLGLVRGTGAQPGTLLVGAHLDHIGHGVRTSRTGSVAIHNGADDNASGSAAVLELARRIAQRPAARDVVFAWFGAEELGLVGSTHLATHPVPATATLAAMVNFDMVGRLRDCRVVVEGRETARGFAEVVRRANAPYRFDARPWDPRLGAWGSSDHESFSSRGTPVLFFFTGLHADYHTERDDLPTLDLRGTSALVGFAERAIRDVASLPPRGLAR